MPHKIVTLLIRTLSYLIKIKLAPSMTISKCSKHYFSMKYPQQILLKTLEEANHPESRLH